MSVFQIKDGRWCVQYKNPNPPPRLRREYFGRGFEGEKRARERNEELGLGSAGKRTPERDSKTFGHLAQAYLDSKRGQIAVSTIERLHIKLAKVILPEIGRTDVRRLTHRRIDQYVNKRLKTVKRVTVHNEVTYIQAILNWAVEERYIRINPLARYKKPVRDDAIIQPVTADEARRILQKSPAHLVRALALSYYTGLRPGRVELLRLKWSAVDWDLQTIIVISARKRGPASRQVPVHNDFLPILKRWYDQDMENGKTPNDFIITFRGKPIDRISKAFTSAKRRAGITRKLPPYAFRHSFATGSLAAGGDLKAISEILGHSRTDTTTRIYHHTNLTLKRDSINKLPKLDIPVEKGKGL